MSLHSNIEQYLTRIRDELKMLSDVNARIKASHEIIADHKRTGANQGQIQGEEGRLEKHKQAKEGEVRRLHELVKSLRDVKQNRDAWNELAPMMRERVESAIRDAEHAANS